jgi:hypothetical protein
VARETNCNERGARATTLEATCARKNEGLERLIATDRFVLWRSEQVMAMIFRFFIRAGFTLTLMTAALATGCAGADPEAGPREDGEEAREATWSKTSTEFPPAVSDAAAPCPAPSVFFPDDDGDGFGRTADGVRACARPPGQWASAGGDCADSEWRVHPAQRIYFPEPYEDENGEPSFDYDCNGYEDSDPRQPGGAPNCQVLSIAECGGTGYIATERPGGGGVNVLCGSRSMFTCKPNTLGFLCGPDHELVDEALRCH